MFLWFVLRLLLVAAMAVAVAGWIARGSWGRRRRAREVEAAARAFGRQASQLGEALRAGAAANADPGERLWADARLADGAPLMARDRVTGELYALVVVTIGPEQDSGACPAGTAVFVWRGGRWAPTGRSPFGTDPEQTLGQHAKSLVRAPLPGQAAD